MLVFAEKIPNLDRDKPESILYAAEHNQIDLTVIGGETMLKRGIVNMFDEFGLPIVGGTAKMARLETSKWDCCKLLEKAGVKIPKTAYCEGLAAVMRELEGREEAVIKPDGDTLGKGVVVMASLREKDAAIEHVSAYPGRFLIQDLIRGREISFFVAANNRKKAFLGSGADYKLLNGKMTGGMGGYSPHELLTDELFGRIMDEVVEPVLAVCEYRGLLYFQLMITPDGEIYVIEINVRFGDPEAQLLTPLYRGDLASVLASTCKGRVLDSSGFGVEDMCTFGYVLAAAGYPDKAQTGEPINGLGSIFDISQYVFQAGTKSSERGVVTDGGRVLAVVGKRQTYAKAKDSAERARNRISFAGMQFRYDIGEHLFQEAN
jgi:phosphoribosylamine--glycine ligase